LQCDRVLYGLNSGPCSGGPSVIAISSPSGFVLPKSLHSRCVVRLCVVRLKEQKNVGPCLLLWARGSPSFLSFASPSGEGVGAPTRRMIQVRLDRSGSAWLPGGPGSPGPGRETSRPAPCGAPTRHLGLCAFDRGRTGPARSGRRGCPSTARGRRLRLPTLAGAAPVPRLQDAS
jgi:hypothetical protein